MRAFTSWVFTLALVPIGGCGGGDGTSSGGAGSGGGSSGAGGTGGMTAFDPPGPKDQDAALKAAIFMGSCIPDLGINDVLNQIYTEKSSVEYARAFLDTTDCLATRANGCKAVEECLGITFDATGPCNRSCEGMTSVGCNGFFKFRVDCAKLGLTCSATGNACIEEPLPPVCDPTTYMENCTDGAPHTCPPSPARELTGLVCADYGVVCGDSPGVFKVCIGGGPACNVPAFTLEAIEFDHGIACDGTSLRACVNGFEHLLDCSTLATSFTCQMGTISSFCGLAAECEPGAGAAPACEGDHVVVCNAGRMEKVDCHTLGFTGCDPMLGVCVPNVFSQP